MGEARPKRFGEVDPKEKAIIQEIIFLREVKKLSYQKISDHLNAEAHWPRRALAWSWILVYGQYKHNTLPGSKERKCENTTR